MGGPNILHQRHGGTPLGVMVFRDGLIIDGYYDREIIMILENFRFPEFPEIEKFSFGFK